MRALINMNKSIIITFAVSLFMCVCPHGQAQVAVDGGSFAIEKYLEQMQDNPELRFAFGEYELKEYALFDIDGDGKDEVWVRDSTSHYQAIYTIEGDNVMLIAYADGSTDLEYYRNAVKYSAYYSPGRSCVGAQIVKDSKLADYCLSEVNWDIFSEEEEVTDEWYLINNKVVTAEDVDKFLEQLGDPIPEPPLKWLPISSDEG